MLDAYFADIARRPLLPPDQQQALAVEVRDSRRDLAALERERQPPSAELAAARRRAARALDRFVSANLRLVLAIVRKEQGRIRHSDALEVSDLLQEGNLGLIRAAELFDPDRGTKFSTYAMWHITKGIQRVIQNHARAVRVPVWSLDGRKRFTAAVQRAGGAGATDERIAAELGTSAASVRRMRQAVGAIDAAYVRIDGFDTLGADDAPAPDELVAERRRAEQARELLQTLPPREARILRARFEDGVTLREAGKIDGLCRERVRQLEALALDKLRQLADQRSLRSGA